MADVQRTPTTGVPFDISSTGGHPPLRRDLNDLVKDKISFSLFVQALARFQAEPEKEDLSWFQISGIHGLPYTSWQNAGGATGAANTGYCTHNSDAFPAWHRPYLALFEQILCKHAQDIAATTNNQEWKDAADKLRLPYWDWAIKKMLPLVTTLTSLDIIQPDGTMKTLDKNPLLSYTFKEKTSIELVAGSETDRDPSYMDDETSSNMTEEIRGKLMPMFMVVHDWYNFSNDGRAKGDAAAHGNSLEAIHDDIHGSVGGFMRWIDKAAFDPIFWLHHCNIDRFFALWQKLNPSVWLEPTNTLTATTWTIAKNTVITEDTPLTPFYSPSKISTQGFWTSAEVKEVSTFGYSYPELAALKTDDHTAEMLAVVTKLYGQEFEEVRAAKIAALRASATTTPVLDTAASIATSEAEEAKVGPDGEVANNVSALPPSHWWEIPAQKVLSARSAPCAEFGGAGAAAAEEAPAEPKETSEAFKESSGGTSDSEAPPSNAEEVKKNIVPLDTGLTDWLARISVEKYALGTSFRVCIFLIPEGIDNSVVSETDASGWPKSPYYVGQMCAFVNGTAAASCGNCVQQQENNLVIEGYVPLDRHVVKFSGLKTFGHEEVHAYLHKNMVWRVQKVGGPVVPISEVPTLEIGVWSTTLVYNLYDWKSTVVPKWSEPHCHRGITAGQPGGCQHTGGPYTPMLEVEGQA